MNEGEEILTEAAELFESGTQHLRTALDEFEVARKLLGNPTEQRKYARIHEEITSLAKQAARVLYFISLTMFGQRELTEKEIQRMNGKRKEE